MKAPPCITLSVLLVAATTLAGPPVTLPDTRPLKIQDDLSLEMMAGIGDFLDRKTDEAAAHRHRHWSRDTSSPAAYAESVRANRNELRRILGLVDDRLEPRMQHIADHGDPALVAETRRYRVHQVRWPVLEGVWGEGLLLSPRQDPAAHVVALPDADQTPEQIVGLAEGVAPASQYARRLADAGCQVLVPVLISRGRQSSGNPKIDHRPVDQTHRQWLHRPAYEMGRTIMGYEVQKVAAAVDWFRDHHGDRARTGVIGYGEGGLIALHAAATDPRIHATAVSGYFRPREKLAREPVFRNVWSLLERFGDAELASLVAPRPLIVEYAEAPPFEVPLGGNADPAPGRNWTAPFDRVAAEVDRARKLTAELDGASVTFVHDDGRTIHPGSPDTLRALLGALGTEPAPEAPPPATDRRRSFDSAQRQRRQVRQIEEHIQMLLRYSHHERDAFVLDELEGKPADQVAAAARPLKDFLWEEVLGKIDEQPLPPTPRTRRVYDRPNWTGYEVTLEVFPESFAYGILLLPKDLDPGERRPVVVCQHGGGGIPRDVIEPDRRPYHAFAAKLAERGFIVYAPHNPHNGRHRFGPLQRQANPLGLTLWSVILAHHSQHLRFLQSVPHVDPERIGFYGLSYGGKTAMRVPALLDGYALSICSGDFNEWIRKNVTNTAPYSYIFTHEYDQPEFNLGHTFNYAEMAYLIFPRPFMVERGYRDGVAPDRWVAAEYVKVHRFYHRAGLADRTDIEFFQGRHEIHGQGTFDFLHEHLNWPKPGAR